MKKTEIETWLESTLPSYHILTQNVINIIESLLTSNNIDYLAVTGRTKKTSSIHEKIKRKSYKQPDKQLTDISGIRIIVYFESDVEKVSNLIEKAFSVDADNSLNKQSLLASNQLGYRSIHYVCDLGEERHRLPEFNNLKNLKFEFQLRTVLQHAWAELAHDRNYKFTGVLPGPIERKLYLYAGMLELADRGFDEISHEIDQYIKNVQNKTNLGEYDIEINSLSIEQFVADWAETTGFHIDGDVNKEGYIKLVDELDAFGIHTLSDLKAIIPDKFYENSIKHGYSTTSTGIIRDWMILNDYKKYSSEVSIEWSGVGEIDKIYSEYIDSKSIQEIHEIFDEIEDENGSES